MLSFQKIFGRDDVAEPKTAHFRKGEIAAVKALGCVLSVRFGPDSYIDHVDTSSVLIENLLFVTLSGKGSVKYYYGRTIAWNCVLYKNERGAWVPCENQELLHFLHFKLKPTFSLSVPGLVMVLQPGFEYRSPPFVGTSGCDRHQMNLGCGCEAWFKAKEEKCLLKMKQNDMVM